MYYLNKIVGWMTSPIAVTFLVAVAGLVFARFGRRRLGVWLMGGAVAWLWLWATPAMTRIVGAPLEREFLVDGRVPAVESFPEAGAIVLLGGAMGVDTNLSGYAEMWMSADRVWQAARLWKAGKSPRIIATGDEARESTLGLLKDFGVDEKCVEFLDARNTEEEARVVGKLFNRVERVDRVEGIAREGDFMNRAERVDRVEGIAREGDFMNRAERVDRVEGESGVSGQELVGRGQSVKPKVLLVTSAWHMKRARMMFEKYAKGIEVVCAPADFEMSMAAKKGWKVVPDAYSLHLNSVAVHEWVGIVGYGVMR